MGVMGAGGGGPRTLVFWHAHPDDEALLTAGTMARAATEGHRVILVVATDGAAGLAAASYSADLAHTRSVELRASAAALGVAKLIEFGYADSGLHGDAVIDPAAALAGALVDSGGMPSQRLPTLCSAPIAQVAQRLAEVLRAEAADVLITYDANGGYGHPDHVRCHDVGHAAAKLAGTPRVFEATVPRDLLAGTVKLIGRVYRFPPEFDPTSFDRAFTASADITHRVNVRDYAAAKRASMAAHASQATADSGDRTLAAFLRLPMPIFRAVFGTEWYVEVQHPVS